MEKKNIHIYFTICVLNSLLLYSKAAGFVAFSTGQFTQRKTALIINTLRNHLLYSTVLHNGMLAFPADRL